MRQDDTCADHYLGAHIAEALAMDERTNALDVRVHVAEAEIVVTGVVACAARLAAAEQVISECLPQHKRLVNRLRIERFVEPPSTEPVL